MKATTLYLVKQSSQYPGPRENYCNLHILMFHFEKIFQYQILLQILQITGVCREKLSPMDEEIFTKPTLL